MRSVRVTVFVAMACLVGGALSAAAQERYLGASANSDGTVRIEVADGGQTRVHIEPALKPLPHVQWQHVGVGKLRIAADRTAVGWLARFAEKGTYGDDRKLVVRTNGRTHVIDSPTVIWRWNFVENSSQVGYMAMPAHGWTEEGYYLVEITTGRVIAMHAHDILDKGAPPLPDWVKAVNARN